MSEKESTLLKDVIDVSLAKGGDGLRSVVFENGHLRLEGGSGAIQHPAFNRRIMNCLGIESIRITDHNSILVTCVVQDTSLPSGEFGLTTKDVDCKYVEDIKCLPQLTKDGDLKAESTALRLSDLIENLYPESDRVLGTTVIDSVMSFAFEEYFTDEVRAELEEAFENGEYDDLGNLPEF